MKLIKPFFCFFISLFMVLSLFALQASIFTHNRLYNNNYYTERFQTLGLSSFINDSLSTNLAIIQRECNLPKSIFDNLYNKTSISNDVNSYTKSTIDYMTYKSSSFPTPDTKKYTNKFDNKLDTFLSASNVKLDVSSKADITNIKTQTASTIKNEIYQVNFESLANSSSFQKARLYINKLYSFESIFVGIFILLTILLAILEARRLFIFVTWFSSTLIAGGLIVLIPVVIIMHTNFTNNLALNPPKLQLIVGTILRDYLQSMLNYSIYITLVGILIFIGNIILSHFKTVNS